jgi:hypothetical protein
LFSGFKRLDFVRIATATRIAEFAGDLAVRFTQGIAGIGALLRAELRKLALHLGHCNTHLRHNLGPDLSGFRTGFAFVLQRFEMRFTGFPFGLAVVVTASVLSSACCFASLLSRLARLGCTFACFGARFV